MRNLQLCQQPGFRAVLIADAPCAGAAPVPAVSKLNCQSIFAALQQIGHVVGLVLRPLAIFSSICGASLSLEILRYFIVRFNHEHFRLLGCNTYLSYLKFNISSMKGGANLPPKAVI